MTFYIARHTSAYNPKNEVYRRKPGFLLSDEGKKEAEALALFLKENAKIKTIYTSPLERSCMTAEMISKENGNIPIIIKEYLNEWDVGERTKDIEKRMSTILKDARENVLFISHRDLILVFLNKFFPRDTRYSEQDCPPACLYELKYNKVKKAEAIF